MRDGKYCNMYIMTAVPRIFPRLANSISFSPWKIQTLLRFLFIMGEKKQCHASKSTRKPFVCYYYANKLYNSRQQETKYGEKWKLREMEDEIKCEKCQRDKLIMRIPYNIFNGYCSIAFWTFFRFLSYWLGASKPN